LKIDYSCVIETSDSFSIDGICSKTFLFDLQDLIPEVVEIKLWVLKIVNFRLPISFGINQSINGAFDSCDDLFDEGDDFHDFFGFDRFVNLCQ